MDIYLDDKTSLLMIRTAARVRDLIFEPTDIISPKRPPVYPAKLGRLGIPGLLSYLGVPESASLGIAVPRKEDRVRVRGIENEIVKELRGPNAFARLVAPPTSFYGSAVPNQTDVYVQSAPNVVLGMARRLRRLVLANKMTQQRALLLLVKLCLELCGTYSHDPFSPNEGSVVYGVTPRTRVQALRQTLEPPGREQGLALARKASAMAYDLSGSPQESFLGPALFFPAHLGGLDLGEFVANEALSLSPAQHEAIGYRTITPDFQMLRYRLAVEYKGKVHEEGDNPRIDHVRSLDYQTVGTRELAFVYGDVSTQDAFMESASRIVSIIEQCDGPGVRARFGKLLRSSSFHMRQRVLFEVFRPWLR